jgi:hypothetical protein
MTREEAISKLKGLQSSGDTESAHGDADQILCDLLSALGYQDVVEQWEKIDKWYA